MNRRAFLSGAIGVAAARAQQQSPVSSTPSPRDYMRQDPIQYPDPDIIALDNRFRRYIVGNTPIRRLHFGTLWAEGPAWNGVGRYLVWSDIPNNVQMRWIEDDGRVTVFRNPSGYSNGNTFDFEGRQLSCEHGGRRVVRYEPNGTVTVIAEKFQGKRLNSPNDIVVHPDGSIWFTDPPYGIRGNYEGFKAESELPTLFIASMEKHCRSISSTTKSAGPTAFASHRTTRSFTSPIRATGARSKCGTSTAKRFATENASFKSTFPEPASPPPQTASAATSTATSGPARVLASR